ncbi:hypothetical protein B0H10DRAFT_2161656 [Mycena sp. CBHHK59/15]|nr:hypothetical protein B0H10DRAFT_2161656 [Mycena sp. CBHHK59/15]
MHKKNQMVAQVSASFKISRLLNFRIYAARTQCGDAAQLSIQVTEALQFLQATEQVNAALFITAMVALLDEACHLLVISCRTPTGGQPQVEIDHYFLSQALDLQGTTHLSSVLNCSAQTVHCRALEYGLAQRRHPVYTDTPQPDNTVARSYTSTSHLISTLTDTELNTLLTSILEVFPDFGRRMLSGRLKTAGHHVLRLIRFKIVIHCFIDGKSHFVTGIRVSNNNCATTVLDLFHDAVTTHGFPSSVKKFFTDLEVHHGLNP